MTSTALLMNGWFFFTKISDMLGKMRVALRKRGAHWDHLCLHYNTFKCRCFWNKVEASNCSKVRVTPDQTPKEVILFTKSNKSYIYNASNSKAGTNSVFWECFSSSKPGSKALRSRIDETVVGIWWWTGGSSMWAEFASKVDEPTMETSITFDLVWCPANSRKISSRLANLARIQYHVYAIKVSCGYFPKTNMSYS